VQYQSETNAKRLKGDEMTEIDFELLDFLVECMNTDKRMACETLFVAQALGYLFFKYGDTLYEYLEILKRKNYS
jgi:hypothetical protein